MPVPDQRHGSQASSGGESAHSQDTVKGNVRNRPSTPDILRPGNARQWSYEDGQISPGSNPALSAGARADIAPWDASPTTSHSHTVSYLNQHMSHRSGSKNGDNARTQARSDSPVRNHIDEDRRPSVASSADSTGSNASRSQQSHRKLRDWFGEEDLSKDRRYNQPRSTPQHTSPVTDSNLDVLRPSYKRTPSFGALRGRSFGARQLSPDPSRPNNPKQPSSEVTPWLYQNPDDIPHLGDAPVGDKVLEKERLSRHQTNESSSKPHGSAPHRFPLHWHRHQRGSEGPASNGANSGTNQLTQTSTNKTEAFPSLPREQSSQSSITGSGLPSRQMSSSPSRDTLREQVDGPPPKQQQESGAQKRRLLDRFRRHKTKSDADRQDASPSGSQSRGSQREETIVKQSAPPAQGPPLEQIITKTKSNQPTDAPQPPPSRREGHSRLPFKRSRATNDSGILKDPNSVRGDVPQNSARWILDTDLENMEGIVQQDALQDHSRQPGAAQPTNKPQVSAGEQLTLATHAAWDAPDSWAVKRLGEENEEKLHEIDEHETHRDRSEPGLLYSIRIFRPDGNFNTMTVDLSTTVAELVNYMGQKNYPQDDINRFHIIMQKHDTSRQLDPGERPVAIQKRLLQQAGYEDQDHLERLGQDDHSYLCRFTFLPAKMIGYSTLDKDLSLNTKQKFSNVDLQSRSLNTIPIALYQKSGEIVFLNLSRNLNLDVPKDFVTGCTSLREIRYTGNEAMRLPPSFSLANRLTVLDVSNNRLEQMDHAELERLPNLASLRIANNRLKTMPGNFSNFRCLRSLNVSSNFLTELPECICSLKTLVDLDVSFNAIEKLAHIAGLESLERLWATNNKLSGRPEGTVERLHNLREIDIRFNAIHNLDSLARLPQLEHLMAGHNSITAFEGTFPRIRTLYLDHNPITRFELGGPVPTLSTLSLASAKLAEIPDDLYGKMTGLTKLILTKNHIATLTPQLRKLQKLDHLSIAKNSLGTLPAEIGYLAELRFLDVRENNISHLPSEIWLCRKLETFNASSNVLDSFPKPATSTSLANLETSSVASTPSVSSATPIAEEPDNLGDFGPLARRPSQASGYLSSGNGSSGNSQRKNSVASTYGPASRKPSMLSRTPTDLATPTPLSRKDSMLASRITSTFAGSLRHLFLADNRLGDEVFDQLVNLQELRVINLSYNELYEVPARTLRRWQYLTELYLSGNDLTSLPSEDFEDCGALRVLHINGNKFQVLPAELGKVQKLATLDASSNALKYNVTNWPYDWNWNWNRNLKYLSLSGNRRLEIKPSGAYTSGRENQNLTDFGNLPNLRVLGLMDVTLMISSVPDETDDRRVRTSGSNVGNMPYGISDTLGNNEHLTTIERVATRLEGRDDETLICLFDGVPFANGGARVAKYLRENFELQFKEELKARGPDEGPTQALRRTYLALNKELATWGTKASDGRKTRDGVASSTLTKDDLNSGCVATVLYLNGMDLYVSNVGNAEAMLIQSEGSFRAITRKHDPAEASERLRIRDAGGYVSRQGKLNDVVDVSRAFGFSQLIPAIVAAPHVSHIKIQESDEMILLASRELWDYLTPDFAVDLARTERNDLMRAAQKLRDLAIAFGASGKITVMLIGVSDLRRRERARYRTHSMSMGPSGLPDDYIGTIGTRRGRRGRDATLDSKLARLDQEVEAPVGEVSLVFTDIKNSTMLWETYPIAMRSAIKMHNEVMRRHLRLIGGYEVKTEGDAFMVAFPTVTSALLWTFTIQSQLLEVQWPQEILDSVNGQEVSDSEGNVLFRGLSVRMGIHWGNPVHEPDPVTRRMDYFGPMVNRAARISSVADGGQITVSYDFIAEVQRLLETHIESDRTNSTGSEDTALGDDTTTHSIRRELRSLSSHGFEVKDLGEKRLKGLENPEYIYLIYPHALAGRLTIQQQRAEAEKAASSENTSAKARNSQLTIDLQNVWDLWNISLRLEMLCSMLECRGGNELKAPETALLERTRERGGEITDRFLVNFVEHQVSRIETCTTTLALRNMVRPFSGGLTENACPMTDIFAELQSQLTELKTIKDSIDIDMAPS